MPTVRVNQKHEVGRTRARQALASFEEMLGKYRVRLDWQGDRADIKGVGIGGEVQVTDSAVDVRVELGFLAKAAGVDADRLQGSIQRRLQEALGGQVPA